MGSYNVNAVVGLQWGDEGKGRVVDYLAKDADLVIRYQGGDNAGHTVINDKGKFGLHIIPSGVFNPETMNIVSAGTVVNFDRMHEELENIKKVSGLEIDNLFIDERAHIIMPYHMALDGAEEGKRSDKEKIGTTKRGIGPCYSDKASRMGIRAADILEPERLEERLKLLLPKKNRDLEYYGLPTVTLEDMMALCAKWKEEFGRHIIDTVPVVRDAVESGKKILLEGQLKAYSTSVGGGPYMTELFDADGDKLRDIGHEFGVTTGRPRRCGWFDAVAADYACYMNGVTDVALTKLDVLDTFPKIKVCTGYRIDGEYYTHLPETRLQERAKPVYEEFDGWMSDTTACRTWESLPEKAKEYILALEKLMNTHITYISVGPERDQLIIR